MTPDDREAGGSGYGWYALAILILAYVLAFLDRQILNLLVQPIKHDLGLSDVEISLLQGLSFALFLSIAGLPIGRLVDTGRRTRLLGIGIALWSLASAGCGLVSGYTRLLACRIGVGVGEATMTPTAYSLIGDYFPARRQGLAIGLYSVGAYLGAGLALIVGAEIAARVPAGDVIVPLLGTLRGWQLVFVLVGLAGLPIALWVATLREPRRRGHAASVPIGEVIAWFRGRAMALILVNLCVAFAAMAMYGLSSWLPTFFLRRFGIAAPEAGRTIGAIVMIAGSLGTLSAGLIGDRLTSARHPDARLRIMIAGALLALPCAAAAMSAGEPGTAFCLLAPTIFFLTLAVGSGPASLQQVTPGRMRGMQHAFAVLAVNLIGLGLGPTVVALITDHVLHDEARIGTAMAAGAVIALALSASCGVLALGPYRRTAAHVA